MRVSVFSHGSDTRYDHTNLTFGPKSTRLWPSGMQFEHWSRPTAPWDSGAAVESTWKDQTQPQHDRNRAATHNDKHVAASHHIHATGHAHKHTDADPDTRRCPQGSGRTDATLDRSHDRNLTHRKACCYSSPPSSLDARRGSRPRSTGCRRG